MFSFMVCRAYAQTWNGASVLGGNAWSSGGLLGNWSGAAAPSNNGTADVFFAGSTRLTPDMDANWSINSLTFNSGAGTFTLGSTGAFILTIQGGGITNNSTNTETINNAITLGAAQTWSATSGNLTFGGNIANGGFLLTISGSSNTTASGVISGSGGLSKSGSGTLTLSGANTYTGKTSIQNGTLSVSSLNKVTGGSASSSLGAPTTVANGTIDMGSTTTTGTLIYTGSGETTDRVINLAGTTGGATIQNDGSGALTFSSNLTATGAGSKTLTLQGSNTGSNTISGAIVDNSGSNTTSVTKAGAGKWILSGANTYTGATTINAGTLSLDSAGSTTARLASTTSISVNSGGTLLLANSSGTTSTDRINNSATMTLNGGTFNTGGLSEHGASNNTAGIGALTLQSTSTIDMGNLASIVAFANSHLASWSGTLNIYDWTGTVGQGGGTDQLYVGSDNTGLTASQLAEINFYSDAGTTFLGHPTILANGEICPIPEPSTWLAAALSLATVGYAHRRRLCVRRARGRARIASEPLTSNV